MGDDEWTTDTGQNLARLRKACSTSLHLLRSWAIAEGISDLKTCFDCRPIEDDLAVGERAEQMLEEGFFGSAESGDARRRVFTSIVQRQGQPAFRSALLAAYDKRCAITGCDVDAVLEAAHIIPYQGVWTNHPQNDLLLRADVHTLFDLGLVAVDSHSMTLLVSPKLLGSSYTSLAGAAVSAPTEPGFRPKTWPWTSTASAVV
jgi:hypothetical protein